MTSQHPALCHAVREAMGQGCRAQLSLHQEPHTRPPQSKGSFLQPLPSPEALRPLICLPSPTGISSRHQQTLGHEEIKLLLLINPANPVLLTFQERETLKQTNKQPQNKCNKTQSRKKKKSLKAVKRTWLKTPSGPSMALLILPGGKGPFLA